MGCFGGTGGAARRVVAPYGGVLSGISGETGGGGVLGREKFLDRGWEDCYNEKLQGTLGADPLQLHCSQGDSSAVTIGK